MAPSIHDGQISVKSSEIHSTPRNQLGCKTALLYQCIPQLWGFKKGRPGVVDKPNNTQSDDSECPWTSVDTQAGRSWEIIR
ncbi:hypothetical protein TNCV_3780621 [Trichonephila clavipes]|nr:hypothetical protein TNCV_3780621 [Trichonephila clavipes]